MEHRNRGEVLNLWEGHILEGKLEGHLRLEGHSLVEIGEEHYIRVLVEIGLEA